MLRDCSGRPETQGFIERFAFFRGDQQDIPFLGLGQCRVHEFAANTAFLPLGGNDYHAERGEIVAERPPENRTDNSGIVFSHSAMPQTCNELPVFDPVGPVHG